MIEATIRRPGSTQIEIERHDPAGIFGPAQYLTQKQVKEADSALQLINLSDLRKKFDLQEMAADDIYPLSRYADRRPREQDVEDEWEGYKMDLENLKAYFHRAAQQNKAVIFWIS